MTALKFIGPETRDGFLADQRVNDLLGVEHWIRQFDYGIFAPTKAAASRMFAVARIFHRPGALHVLTGYDAESIRAAFSDAEAGTVLVWHSRGPIVRLLASGPVVVGRLVKGEGWPSRSVAVRDAG